MDFRLLKYFLTIAEEENITKAAEKLKMSQPPLSRQLKQLEDQLGVTLFVRGRRKMQLTEAGVFLKKQGYQILELMQKTEDNLRKEYNENHGMISIGAIETIASGCLPEWIHAYKKIFPSVYFKIWNGNSDDIIDRLEKGLLDIAFIREPFHADKYQYFQLPVEPWVVLIHSQHRLATYPNDFLPLQELSEEDLIIPSRSIYGKEISEWFFDIGVNPHIFCVYNALMSAVALVRENAGIALCPLSVRHMISKDDFIYKPILPMVSSRAVVIWKKYGYLSGVANQFLALVQKQVKKAIN